MAPNKHLINVNVFIMEIKQRPALWNPCNKDYKDRDVKRIMWQELTAKFGKDLHDMKKKKMLAIQLQKKWKNLKYCYFKEIRRLKNMKNNSTSQNIFPYFEQLQFLKETASNVEYSKEPEVKKILTTEPNRIPQLRTVPIRKEENNMKNVVGNEIIKLLKSNIELQEMRETFDPNKAFLLSLIDDFRKVPDCAKTTLKIEMIKLIQNYQLQSEIPAYCIENETNVNLQNADNSPYFQELKHHYSNLTSQVIISDDSSEHSITVSPECKYSEFINCSN